MPLKSEKQRRYMWANHPEIAERWSKEYGEVQNEEVKKKSRRPRKKAKK